MVDLLGLWLGIIKCIHFKEVLMSDNDIMTNIVNMQTIFTYT